MKPQRSKSTHVVVRPASALLLGLALFGCGGAVSTVVGTGNRTPNRDPVELTIPTPEGAVLELSEMRGTPLILFVFATFDGVSQAALQPIRSLLQRHPELVVLGIAAQPDAETFVDAWVSALEPPFVTGYDATGDIARGLSELGHIDAVPMFFALDSEGAIADRYVGFPANSDLERLVEAASREP